MLAALNGATTCQIGLGPNGNSANYSVCLSSLDAGTLNVNDTFTVTGDAATLVGLNPNGGTINVNKAVTMTMPGISAYGTYIAGGGKLNSAAAAPISITLSGTDAHGVAVLDANSVATLNGAVTVNNSGAVASGVSADFYAFNGGKIIANGRVNLTATDPSAIGILITDANSSVDASASTGGSVTSNDVALALKNGSAQVLKLNKSTISNTTGDLIQANAATTGAITLSNSTATANATGNLFNVSGASTVTLTDTGTAMTGPILTAADSTSTVNMDAASTWSMTASSNLTNLNNAGVVTFKAPSGTFAAKTLTLPATGSLSGGGTMVLNTVLGDSSSPTDSVVMNGATASGVTKLTIMNAAGLGAATTGNGIMVVNNAGGAGTFVLSGPVTAGAYRYSLVQVGTSWYLQSTYDSTLLQGKGISTVPALSQTMLLLLGMMLSAGAALRLRRSPRK